MSSDKKRAANRRNAKKSTGPKTPRGKAFSSKNATKLGIYAGPQLLPGESRAEYGRLLRSLTRDVQPQDTVEAIYVTEMVGDLVRLNRLNIAERSFVVSKMHSARVQNTKFTLEEFLPTVLASLTVEGPVNPSYAIRYQRKEYLNDFADKLSALSDYRRAKPLQDGRDIIEVVPAAAPAKFTQLCAPKETPISEKRSQNFILYQLLGCLKPMRSLIIGPRMLLGRVLGRLASALQKVAPNFSGNEVK